MTEQNEPYCCPICEKPFKTEDVCADDITEGTCHAECLEGSPVVDLQTGDELPDGKADTYLYSDVMDPAPQPHVPCPCTLIEQDEDCPICYPSMLCGICNGTSNATQEQVTALACEMIKIASDIGGPEDPFAAWESIDLIKSQHGQMRKALTDARALLYAEHGSDGRVVGVSHEMDGLRRMVALLDAVLATTEGQP